MPSHPARRCRTTVAAWVLRGAALALLAPAGCALSEKTADMAAANVQAATQAQTNPTLSTSDSLFIDEAARAGLAEVQEGKVAEAQGHLAAVRRFGTMMVKDHGELNDQLLALAHQKQLTPPATPSDYQQGEINGLQTVHGQAFDSQFIDGQVASHQQALMLFQTEARQGTDPDVKALAARAIPVLEHHLEMARKLGGRSLTS
jgi:putative membrane protein